MYSLVPSNLILVLKAAIFLVFLVAFDKFLTYDSRQNSQGRDYLVPTSRLPKKW